MVDISEDDLVDIKEAAAIMGISVAGLHARRREHGMDLSYVEHHEKGKRGPGKYLFRRADVIQARDAFEARRKNRVIRPVSEEETITTTKTASQSQSVTLSTIEGTGEYVSSDEAARILGMNRATFYIQKNDGRFPFQIVGYKESARGGRPMQIFRREEVERFALESKEQKLETTISKTIRRKTDNSGEVAAFVFEMLDEGRSPVEIVKMTKLEPKRVEEIKHQWSSMKEVIVIDGTIKRALEFFFRNTLPLPNFKGIDSGRVLLESVRQLEAKYLSVEDYKKRIACKACVNRYEINPKEAVLCNACARSKFELKDEGSK